MGADEIRRLSDCLRELLEDLSRSCYYLKRQQIYWALGAGQEIWKNLSDVAEQIAAHIEQINGTEPIVDMEGMLYTLQNLQEAQEHGDYVLLADLYELQLMPVLISVQERLVTELGVFVDEERLQKNVQSCAKVNPPLLSSLLPENVIEECKAGNGLSDEAMEAVVTLVERCMEAGYAVELTSCGALTLSVQKDGHSFYLHTNGQVVDEAIHQAEEWLCQGQMSYTFYGLGMGYPYQEMLSMDDNVTVTVVEMNRELLILAFIFSPLWRLLEEERFTLLYDPTGHRLERMELGLEEEKGFYVFAPALHGVKKRAFREKLEKYAVEESSVRAHAQNMFRNFKANTAVSCNNIQDLREAWRGRDVIIAAAGPSLDHNMEQLKNRKQGMILVAVGTVLKKLLKAGIRPDYTIIIDSGRLTYRQVQEIEDCGVPLLFLSTVYSRIPSRYQGEKYILCQKGFEPAESLAAANGWQTVESGGSVATAALDLGLRLQVNRLIFVGLDLAYTDGLDHADDTDRQVGVTRDTGIMVPGVHGGNVMTGKNLKVYLDWIARRLAERTAEERKIAVIDATEGGAVKPGMVVKELREVL